MSENLNRYKERKAFEAKAEAHSAFLAFNEGGLVYECRRSICYRSLTYGDKMVDEVYLFFGDTLWAKEGAHEWVNWVLNRSPFSDAFITKDSEEARKLGAEIDTSKDWAFVCGAMMALRHHFEVDVWSWFTFVKMGLSEFDAYVCACNVYAYEGSLHEQTHNSNHLTIWGLVGYACYKGECFTPSGETYRGVKPEDADRISKGHWMGLEGRDNEYIDLEELPLSKRKKVVKGPFGDIERVSTPLNITNLKKIIKYYKEL